MEMNLNGALENTVEFVRRENNPLLCWAMEISG